MNEPAQFKTNRDISFLINKTIIEYDITKAGLHALLYMGLINESTCNYWKTRPKSWIVRTIGLHFSSYMSEINTIVTSIVDEFIKINNIANDRIIARKRDALFIYDALPTITVIRDHFTFIVKNRYSSYFYLAPYELYYSYATDSITVKGVDIRFIESHPILQELKKIIRLYESVAKRYISYDALYKELLEFRYNYLSYNLPLGYYREISYGNLFKFINNTTKECVYITTLPLDKDKWSILGDFNFINFIIPFINILPAFYKQNVTPQQTKHRYGNRTRSYV